MKILSLINKFSKWSSQVAKLGKTIEVVSEAMTVLNKIDAIWNVADVEKILPQTDKKKDKN